MKMLKKNQVVIYAIALMLVVAGYLNFTTTGDLSTAVQTSASEEELAKASNIGDAQLVSSNLNENGSALSGDSNYNMEDNQDNKIKNETNNIEIETSTNTSNTSSDYFTSSKLERDTMYSQMLETYGNILNSSNSLETQKQSAQEEITKINNIKNSIMISENLIKTKGIKNVVIFVNDDSISVIVEDDLDKEAVAQIQNIISREMKAEIENIHISNK